MNKSESIKNISAALMVFAVKMGKIRKSAENPFFKSKYAPLPEILEAIDTPLNEAGLIVSQFPDGDGLTTIISHPESGEWMEATYNIHPVKTDPQSIGSAITYARRYALGAVLRLNIDEDDDGNKASQPETDKQWLNEGTQQFNEAKQYITNSADKQAAMAKIMQKYAVSKKTRELLLS